MLIPVKIVSIVVKKVSKQPNQMKGKDNKPFRLHGGETDPLVEFRDWSSPAKVVLSDGPDRGGIRDDNVVEGGGLNVERHWCRPRWFWKLEW